MPIAIDADLDRLKAEEGDARRAKENAELRRDRLRTIVRVIATSLDKTEADYKKEAEDLSIQIRGIGRQRLQMERNGAPKRALKSKDDEADKLRNRRSLLAGERRTLTALLESTKESLERAELTLATLVYKWQVAHAERQRYEMERRGFENRRQLHPRLARRFMERAGLPAKYQNRAIVVPDTDGVRFHIYFGGEGAASGPGHGHFVFNINHGINVYERMPVGDDETA